MQYDCLLTQIGDLKEENTSLEDENKQLREALRLNCIHFPACIKDPDGREWCSHNDICKPEVK